MKTIREVFSNNLRRLRGNRTQADVAEAAGIPLVSYQRVEYGDIPRAPNLAAIASAFGVSETELFADISAGPANTPSDALRILADLIETTNTIPLEALKRLSRLDWANPNIEHMLDALEEGFGKPEAGDKKRAN